jgi:hypothetical protein
VTYDYFAPNLLVNPYSGEELYKKLPKNYFQLLFSYVWKLRPDLLVLEIVFFPHSNKGRIGKVQEKFLQGLQYWNPNPTSYDLSQR